MNQTITTAWIAFDDDYVSLSFSWERYEDGCVVDYGSSPSELFPAWLSELAARDAVDTVIEKMTWRRVTEWDESGAGVFAAQIEPAS